MSAVSMGPKHDTSYLAMLALALATQLAARAVSLRNYRRNRATNRLSYRAR